jgi:hypothetical protein
VTPGSAPGVSGLSLPGSGRLCMSLSAIAVAGFRANPGQSLSSGSSQNHICKDPFPNVVTLAGRDMDCDAGTLFFYSAVVGFEFRALCMLGKWLYCLSLTPQPFFAFACMAKSLSSRDYSHEPPHSAMVPEVPRNQVKHEGTVLAAL